MNLRGDPGVNSGRPALAAPEDPMARNFAFIILFAFSFLALPVSPAETAKDPGWSELQSYVLKTSDQMYHQLITRHFQKVQDKAEEDMLAELANQISVAAGRGQYNHPVSIAEARGNPNVINALTLPGGQIIFLSGILKVMHQRSDALAAEKTPLNAKLGKDAAAFHYRRMVAAVLGHEMGHYFGQHFIRQYTFRAKNLANTKINLSTEAVRYGQEHELESDEFALQMMHRLGYDPLYLLEVLKMLKGERDRHVKSGAMGGNPYLESHPTGNERLAAVATKAQGKEFFARMSGLERAFASIETGADLDRAADILDKEVKRFPQNTHLLTAAAKINHRRWEASAPIDELLFKPAFGRMTFRDDLIPEKGMLSSGAPDAAKLPGDEAIFRKAQGYYQRAMEAQADLLTRSSYAALLAYDPAHRSAALILGESAVQLLDKRQKIERLMALNNLGIVYYHTGDYHSAEQSFLRSAGFLLGKSNFRSKMYVLQQKKMHTVLHGFSQKNMGRLFEGFFNLGQLYNKTGFPKQAGEIWGRYVREMDWQSEWGKYAAGQAGIDLAQIRPGPIPTIAGIGPGASIPVIIRAWGKPESESNYMNYTRWMYPGHGAEITILQGFAKRVRTLNATAGPLSNGAHIGMTKGQAEARFGKPGMERGHQVYYPRLFMVLGYQDEKVTEILLLH